MRYRHFGALTAILLSAVLPGSAGTVGAAAIAPSTGATGTAAVVSITAAIADVAVIPGSVQLQSLDSNGRVVALVGVLHDDGLAGDVTANDGLYTLQTTVLQNTPGVLNYRVAAAFRGSLTRALSAPLTFTVTGGNTGIRILSPGNLLYTNTSPANVSGTVGDPAATVKVNGVNAPVTNGSFLATIPLVEGLNTLTAVATGAGGVTATSTVQVTLDTTPPHITIDSPSAASTTTESSITVSGTANDVVVGTVNAGDVSVTVNGVSAQVANRTYSAPAVALVAGINTIQATGRDRAGNGVTVSTTVIRSVPQGDGGGVGAVVVTNTLSIISGNNQTGTIKTALAAPLVVALTDKSGKAVAGQTVVFTVTGNNGSVLGAAGAAGPSASVTTDANGKAQVTWTLGERSGAGNNTLQASTPLAVSSASFTATANTSGPTQVVVDSGNNQTGVVGQPLAFPFVAVATDAGFNRVPNVPITFTVKQGGGTMAGAFSQTVTTNSDGRAIAVLTLGPDGGNSNNVVEASFPGNPGQPGSFAASGRTPGNPANTKISGIVLDNSNNPIPNVTMRLYLTNQANNNNLPLQIGAPVVTDALGAFTIPSTPVGYFKLMADGTTAPGPKSYPTLEFDIVTVAGQNNTLGTPIYLPALDIVNQVCVDATHGGTLTLPQAPGFSLTILPGSATFPGGSKTGCVSVTPVNADKVPMAPGFGQQPRFIVTIQPVGTTFNPPAPITLPNLESLAANSVTEMYSYDHDLSQFVAIGTGTVSLDGSAIVSNPGVGVLKAGWHCGGNPNVPGSGQPVQVSISTPAPVVIAKDLTAVVASVGTPQPGTYSWTIADAAVATIQGSSTGASVTIKGAGPGKTTLKVRFTCNSVDENGVHPFAEATIEVIVAQVVSVVFEAIDSPLDGNPNLGGGQRIFPEKTTPTDAVNRKRVRVKATITPAVAKIPVFFKHFDVDDPSSDVAPIDPNGSAGNDNKPGGAGTLSAGTAQTDAAGVATVELTIGTQPGDNYKAAASVTQSYLNGVVIDTVNLKDGAGAALPTDNAKLTQLLTVWRKVHVEVDSMDTITGNNVTGSITAINSAAKTVTVDANLDDGSRNKDAVLLAPDNGRFENGKLTVGAVVTAIAANGDKRFDMAAAVKLPFTAAKGITVVSGNITDLVPKGLIFTTTELTSDVAVGDLSGGLITIAGIVGAIPIVSSSGSTIVLDGRPKPAFTAVDDDTLTGPVGAPSTALVAPAFAPAYVSVVYDLGGQNNVPFVLNAEPLGTTSTYKFDNIATEADPAFWTVYLLGAYQANRAKSTFLFWETGSGGDLDPDNEGGILGVVDDINGIGASVFRETLTELAPTAARNEGATTAHEIGHLFNGLHEDLGLMAQTTSRTTTAFSDISVNKIRSLLHP